MAYLMVSPQLVTDLLLPGLSVDIVGAVMVMQTNGAMVLELELSGPDVPAGAENVTAVVTERTAKLQPL